VNAKVTGMKGLKTEELVRAYFLRAGFFVLRSVRLKIGGDDLTDVDLWVYERSATLARRRIVLDIKDKRVPQAAERLFFVLGLAQIAQVEGAGVVTSDPRPGLRDLARRNGVLWIDGADLQRLKESADLLIPDRLSEESLLSAIGEVDHARGSRFFRDNFDAMKSAVAHKFGAASANVALNGFQAVAQEAVAAHPTSAAALVAGRLTFLAAALAAAALDFASAEIALRPNAERLRHLVEAIRYGDDAAGTLKQLRWAEAAIREYAPNGAGVAQVVHERFTQGLSAVPAEALAEVAAPLTKTDALFEIARTLEALAFKRDVPSFDHLPPNAKPFLGAVLDFSGVSRSAFAKAWRSSAPGPVAGGNPPQSPSPPNRPESDQLL
jgi:hypothetical protein